MCTSHRPSMRPSLCPRTGSLMFNGLCNTPFRRLLFDSVFEIDIRSILGILLAALAALLSLVIGGF